MADKTAIEWTDATWNPVTGCTKVSRGCDHCYAERVTERFHGKGSFNQIVLHPNRLGWPLRWTRPRRIFVNSMSDLFHDNVPDSFLDEVFGVTAVAHALYGHTFQVLTKRHGRMRSYLKQDLRQLPGGYIGSTRQAIAGAAHRWAIDRVNAGALSDAIEFGSGWPLPGVWLGVSVENQQWADIRIPALLETPAAVRWLSCEPLLGPIDLTRISWPGHHGNGSITHLDAVNGLYGMPGVWKQKATAVDWVVVGGESGTGTGTRPMHPDWARGLRDQCTDAEVPFFFKQWGESLPLIGHREFLDLPPARQNRDWLRPFGDDVTMCRVGKRMAGRELDGRTWDEYPAGAAS